MANHKPRAKIYTARIVYRTGDPMKGELTTHTIERDVTDCVLEGSTFEEITERIYWHDIHPAGYFDVLSAGVVWTKLKI